MIRLRELPASQPHTIPLTAIIDTALCVGAGGSSGTLADKPIVRTGDGKLLIHASQLKGRLRHECEKLARGLGWQICESPSPGTMCPLKSPGNFAQRYTVTGYRGYHCLTCQIFGNPVLASRILVDDLICKDVDLPEVFRPGVTLNRRRRTSEAQKLYLLETSPMNAQLTFEGHIHLLPDCPPWSQPLLLAGLQHIHALGGSKSTGLGWLRWELKPIESLDWQSLNMNHETNRSENYCSFSIIHRSA